VSDATGSSFTISSPWADLTAKITTSVFDQCTLPNKILMPVVRECGGRIYDVAYNGKTPVDAKPKSIPMVGFSFTKDK
jgi:hypothetical protein